MLADMKLDQRVEVSIAQELCSREARMISPARLRAGSISYEVRSGR